MTEDYTKEIKMLADLYRSSGYRVLKKWLEGQLDVGFNKLLKKKNEETRGELCAELRAYKTVLNHVESAFNQAERDL
jgi:hypothetical protein